MLEQVIIAAAACESRLTVQIAMLGYVTIVQCTVEDLVGIINVTVDIINGITKFVA